jgi:xylan 1,4-beta-xylosidase
MKDYPANAYRNGTMYSSYTAASFPRIYELADHFGVNLRGIVTWAFEFEDQPWFYGYRDLATNGVDKPVLNIFRMFGKMHGRRVEIKGDLAYDFTLVRDSSVRGKQPDISAMATVTDSLVAVLVWNYHDLNELYPSTGVRIHLSEIPFSQATLSHYRVGRHHSNSYEVWKDMGSPQDPTELQYRELEQAGKLQLFSEPAQVTVDEGELNISLGLEGQEVSLLLIRKTP